MPFRFSHQLPRLVSSPLRPLLAAAALPLVLTACGARQDTSEELGVTRVVIYQSGVAYLERAGRVTGDELVMPIRADQINDILATMVVVDRGAGGSTSVSLPIADSAADRMADLPPELRDAGGMVAILYAFRGADVNVRAGAQRVRGRVVGVEPIAGAAHVTILTNGNDLVPIAIEDITDVDLQNESLAMGLRRSLDHSLSEGDWKPTDVTVRFSQSGSHDVTLAYVVEQPIWKPAYRVVVDDDELLLQGWAVIDNVSGADWNNVQLSLTAGSPISFRYDLHSPVFVDRPDMSGYGAPDVANLRPPTPVAAGRSRRRNAQPSVATMTGRVQTESAEDAMMDMEMMAPAAEQSAYGGGGMRPGDIASSGGVSAQTTEVGALVRFDIPGRVTLPDQTSTMVTLVNSSIEGEDALIYQPDSAPASHQHPYRALLLENDTEYPIQRAPIAIYTAGTFVGQGITPLVDSGESAVVAYALEQRFDITQRASSASGTVRLTRIDGGVIRTEVEQIQATNFELRSGLDEAERLYLKVNRLGGWELQDEAWFDRDDVQTETSYYLIPVEVEGGQSRTVSVRQTSDVQSSVDVFSPNAKQLLLSYSSSPGARPDVVAQLEPVLELLDELSTIDRQLAELRRRRNDVDQRTNELRQNLQALGDNEANQDLRRTLTERLAEQDTMQAEIAGDLVERSERSSVIRVLVSEAMREITLQR